MDAHSFAARNFAHLYVVSGRQHSMDAVAKMQKLFFDMVEQYDGLSIGLCDFYYHWFVP